MATYTGNYNLEKPDYNDNADIGVINSNMDKIDAKMKEIENNAGSGGSGSNVEWNQIQTTGSKIAEVTIDGTTTEVYAPSESGGGVDIESEVIDIRLKADGTTATSAGNAVREQIAELKGDLSDLTTNVMFTRNYDAPRCILTDSKNIITSDYGLTYTDLSNMLTNGDWRKYIKNGDYIRLTTLNGETFNMIFNIDTYKNYGDASVGSHIDLISEHLIPSSDGWKMRTDNTNNGTEYIANPFLASGNMIDKLSTYFEENIPSELKNHIVTKRLLVPKRYTAEGTIADDNGWYWTYLDKMWLPFEQEVTGRKVWGSIESQGGLRWYPCFHDGTQLVKKLGETGVRTAWWTASAISSDSTAFVYVSNYGPINAEVASHARFAVPLCMRFK